MATKDFETTEDRGGQATGNNAGPKERYPKEAPGIAEVNSKNAHASGDGSFGRADKLLSDPEPPAEPTDDSTY